MTASFPVLAVTVATALLVGGAGPSPLPASVDARTAAQSAAAKPTVGSTVELSLDGVDPAALATLPESAPPPAEQAEVIPAPQADGTLQGEPAEPVAPAPEPTAEPSPELSPEPSPVPSTDSPTTPAPTSTATPPPADARRSAQAAEDPPAPDVLTAPLDTDTFSVIGVTWDDRTSGDDVVIRYRTKQAGTWGDWEAVGASDVSPDVDSRDAAQSGTRGATDAIVALHADGVQFWAESEAGDVRGLEAVLIDPGSLPSDALPVAATGAAVTRNAALVEAAGPPAPTIIPRSGWGADESLRTCQPDLSTEVVAAAVHHTASSSSYGAADVPALIRGFYAYHTRPEAAGGRGWCDLGYNFLVDQFGRVFEGRAGGVDVDVVGVHTGGFNSRTFAVSAIGSYDTVPPTPAMTEAISRTIAWKFAMHRISGSANVAMVSGGGASKYPAGTVVVFPTIFGHRDAQLTSCPGQLLYNQLAAIRARVSALADAAVLSTPFGSWDGHSTTSRGLTVSGWIIDPETSSPLTVRVAVDGVETSVVADVDRPDVAAAFPGYGSRHGFAVTIPATGGAHAVCVRATNVGEGADRLLGCRWMTVRNAPPVGQVDSVVLGLGTATVTGWALDPDSPDPLQVHVYVDSGATATTANLERADLARYFRTTNHGFKVTVSVPAGTHRLCVYPINLPPGDNPPISCRDVTMPDRQPVGQIDSVAVGLGTATVTGWALDPDTTAPIWVHVYVGSGGTPTLANRTRADLARYFPTTEHGFEVTVRVPVGTHTVCAYAINVPRGDNPGLGCRTVTIVDRPPVGQLDSVALSTVNGKGVATVSGWAVDPDTTAPIWVHVYVDTGGTPVLADRERGDLARYFSTTNHGFQATVTFPAGTHRLCAYAINVPAGGNPELGCRVLTR